MVSTAGCNLLIHTKDELSFKEMRLWVLSKILPGCTCDWCELKEIGGRRSSRLPTPMVDSFSADLPAIKSYWTERPFELCILLGGKYTKLLHIMPLLFELGEEIDFLCVFVAENVLLLLSLLLCILLWWWCVKIAK